LGYASRTHRSTMMGRRARRCLLMAQTDMTTVVGDVRYQGNSGPHLLDMSFSAFDPIRS
jgi:hypothetical protein